MGEHCQKLSPFNAPINFSYVNYENYQENGTKYLKSLRELPHELQNELDSCAGEIFISGIPPNLSPERIAKIACMVSEMYVLRFKVNFSGESRGFAYMQYIDPTIMAFAINRLKALFLYHRLPMLRVHPSRNSSKLLLKRTFRHSPGYMFENLRKFISFQKLVAKEVYPGYFDYLIVFRSNEKAVHARRELLRVLNTLGRNAVIMWDNDSFQDGAGTITYDGQLAMRPPREKKDPSKDL